MRGDLDILGRKPTLPVGQYLKQSEEKAIKDFNKIVLKGFVPAATLLTMQVYILAACYHWFNNL